MHIVPFVVCGKNASFFVWKMWLMILRTVFRGYSPFLNSNQCLARLGCWSLVLHKLELTLLLACEDPQNKIVTGIAPVYYLLFRLHSQRSMTSLVQWSTLKNVCLCVWFGGMAWALLFCLLACEDLQNKIVTGIAPVYYLLFRLHSQCSMTSLV